MDPYLYGKFYEIEDRFWWCVGTRRIFFDVLAGLVPADARVLDLGCGTGVTLKEFPFRYRLLCGSDLAAPALTFCRERGLRNLVRSDGTHLPFADDSLDLITALDVVEHLDDDAGCVRELARVCRPGRYVLLHVPAFQILWSDKDELNHHRRRYRRAQLLALLARCGLESVRTFYINAFLFPPALMRCVYQRFTQGHDNGTAAARASVDGLYRTPERLNRILIELMTWEYRMQKPLPLPFGMSLVSLARKPLPVRPSA